MLTDSGFMPFVPFGISTAFLLIIFFAWSLLWKGWALWRAARNAHKAWFVALLLLNTVGILEILYIFIWSKKDKEK